MLTLLSGSAENEMLNGCPGSISGYDVELHKYLNVCKAVEFATSKDVNLILIGSKFSFDKNVDSLIEANKDHSESPVFVIIDKTGNPKQRWNGSTEYIDKSRINDETIKFFFRSAVYHKKIEDNKRDFSLKLKEIEKLASVSPLTEGIASDLNNIFQEILGYTGLLRQNTVAGSTNYAYIENLEEIVEKAGKLNRNLLKISGRSIRKFRKIDINEVVSDLIFDVNLLLRDDIKLKIRTEKSIWPFMGNRALVEKIIKNICENARDSMPGEGSLTITTKNLKSSEVLFKNDAIQKSKHFALLQFSDTGKGMDEESVKRVFEPFYTTKNDELYSGLGLTFVNGAVKSQNGTIDIKSFPGEGTTISIYFPSLGPSDEEPKESAYHSSGNGHETILLAEDDNVILELAQSILEMKGYRVLSAIDGQAAYDIFRKKHKVIDLAFIDLNMPKINGSELLKMMRDKNPSLKALFSSGLDKESVNIELSDHQDYEVITKPFSPTVLLQEIRRILQKPVKN